MNIDEHSVSDKIQFKGIDRTGKLSPRGTCQPIRLERWTLPSDSPLLQPSPSPRFAVDRDAYRAGPITFTPRRSNRASVDIERLCRRMATADDVAAVQHNLEAALVEAIARKAETRTDLDRKPGRGQRWLRGEDGQIPRF